MRKPFIYSQTRLQARHGMRPDERLWQLLESKQDLANYLQMARQTRLRSWVVGLQSTDNHHVLETALLKEYHQYILEVARWVPENWRESVEWTVALIYLPSIYHLLRGNTAQSWMLDIPELKSIAMSNMHLRMESFSQSRYAPLLDSWQPDQSLLSAWLTCWQTLWPDKTRRQRAPIMQFISLLEQHRDLFNRLSPMQTWRQRQRLIEKLNLLFRQYAFEPVAIFIHLLLVGLDIERLRGAVIQRSLFPTFRETNT